LESDDLGVKFLMDAAYNPLKLIGVMKILKAFVGPYKTPERLSTHQTLKIGMKNYKRP